MLVLSFVLSTLQTNRNVQFRKLVEAKRRVYLCARFKREKRMIAEAIISTIKAKDPPGRFLAKKTNDGLWHPIGDDKAREKTSQALRENAKKFKDEMESEHHNVGNTASSAYHHNNTQGKPETHGNPASGGVQMVAYPYQYPAVPTAAPSGPSVHYGHGHSYPNHHAPTTGAHAGGHEKVAWNYPYGYPQGLMPIQAPVAPTSMQAPAPASDVAVSTAPTNVHPLQQQQQQHQGNQRQVLVNNDCGHKNYHQTNAPTTEASAQSLRLQPRAQSPCQQQQQLWNSSNVSRSENETGFSRQQHTIAAPSSNANAGVPRVQATSFSSSSDRTQVVNPSSWPPAAPHDVSWSPMKQNVDESIDLSLLSGLVFPADASNHQEHGCESHHPSSDHFEAFEILEVASQDIEPEPCWYEAPKSPVRLERHSQNHFPNKRPLSPEYRSSTAIDIHHESHHPAKISKIESSSFDIDFDDEDEFAVMDNLRALHDDEHPRDTAVESIFVPKNEIHSSSNAILHEDCLCLGSYLGLQQQQQQRAFNATLRGERSSVSSPLPLSYSPTGTSCMAALEDMLRNASNMNSSGGSTIDEFGGLFMDSSSNPIPPASLFQPLDGDDSFQPTMYSPRAA